MTTSTLPRTSGLVASYPTVVRDCTIQMSQDEFRRAFGLVLPAAATDKYRRPVLGGILVRITSPYDLAVCAADGYGLNVYQSHVDWIEGDFGGDGDEEGYALLLDAKRVKAAIGKLRKSNQSPIMLRVPHGAPVTIEGAGISTPIEIEEIPGNYPHYTQLQVSASNRNDTPHVQIVAHASTLIDVLSAMVAAGKPSTATGGVGINVYTSTDKVTMVYRDNALTAAIALDVTTIAANDMLQGDWFTGINATHILPYLKAIKALAGDSDIVRLDVTKSDPFELTADFDDRYHSTIMPVFTGDTSYANITAAIPSTGGTAVPYAGRNSDSDRDSDSDSHSESISTGAGA